MQEMKNLGISDAFDNIKSVQSKPGYISMTVPMDVTVNYSGKLGQVGSSAHATQIRVDAFSKETYLSVAMEKNQPGRKAVETLDHLRKARQGLKVPASGMLTNPEALQVATKGTFKAMVTMKISDPELRLVLKKSGLEMTPDQFLNTMDRIRRGHNIAPELAGLDKKNIRSYYRALDETARVCRNQAVQSFQNDMTRARNQEAFLRQSRNPAVRSQLPNAKAGRIDSMIRMRENLNSLIATDVKSNSPLTAKGKEVSFDNKRLGDWMGNIEKGIPQKPVGRMVFGQNVQHRLPGADKVNSLVSKGIQGYKDFRTNAKVAAYAGKGMTVFGGAMIGASWYGMAKANNASEGEALAAGTLAGLATLNRFGSLYLGVKDLEHHLTVKAKKYGEDQALSYALKGMDAESDKVKELINRKVLLRQGVYAGVKAASYSSVFYMNPALMVTGAALEAGLAVYEAYEDADLWQRYAQQLEKANQAMDEENFRRGGWVAGNIARQLALQAKALNSTVAAYHNLMKEKDKIAGMRKAFAGSDEAFQAYLKQLAEQTKTIQAGAGEDQIQSGLTNLERIQHQSDLHTARINQTAAALGQNPDSIGSAQAVLSSMVGQYQTLKMQMDLIHPMVGPMVGQKASQQQDKSLQSPLAALESYQKRLARMEAMLRPRYESAGYLMKNSKKIAEQIQALKKRHADYSASMARYENYLMQQQGSQAATALAEVSAARATIEAIRLPVDWQTGYADQLTKHYFQIRELYKQVQDSAKFLSSLYPEPLGSHYDKLQPQSPDAAGKLNRKWQASSQALTRFHQALGQLQAQVTAIVPESRQDLAQDQEDEVEYHDWDPAQLRQELARLQALKKELGKRSQAAIDNLNKAYFADRDALWKAYENAFKNPKLLPCDNCHTETLHSMDYSDSPPSVWCNVCGRILSFMSWSGSGDSLAQIRTRGKAKKAAILDQLETNRRAVDMAISQVKAAM